MDEWAGAGINGAPSFQGTAFGYGGRAQLAGPPRALPDDFERIVNDLVADELQDILGGSEEPVWTESTEGTDLLERNASDANYRDLPGYPATNTLVAKQGFVPVDPAEQNNVDFLGPTVAGMALKDITGNTANNWKATSPEKRGKLTIDINALVRDQQLPEGMTSTAGRSDSWSPAQLVAQKDWQAEIEDNATGDMQAHNPIGGMGVLHKPIVFIPASAESQVNMTRETVKRTVITPKELTMTSKKLTETIKKMIVEEFGNLEEADAIASDAALALQKQTLDSILAQFGGDYNKAKESPAWKAAIARTTTTAEKEKVSQIAGLPMPFQTKPGVSATGQQTTQQRLQAMRPSVQKTQADAAAAAQADAQAKKNAALKAKMAGLRKPMQPEGKSVPSSEAAEELVLYITSDEEIYEKAIKPAIKNLRRKVLKGTYDPALAPRMWLLVATAAAQKYAREFEMDNWHEHFNLSTRKEAAQDLTQHFERVVKGEE